LLDIYFLPGQGRAPGSKTAFIDVVQFFTFGKYIAEDPLPSDLILKLDAFNVQNRTANSALSDIDFTQASRTFTDLDMTFTRFTREDDFGNQQQFGGEIHKLLDSFLITAFKGRTTAVQLKMHDAMVDEVIGGGGNIVDLNFNTATFISENTNPETGKVTGFLSDYICFDISAVPNKPKLASPSVAGQDAQKVFMSGDGYALSVKDPLGVNGSAGVFEALTKFGTFEGIFRPEESAVTRIKSYELKQADPSQVPAVRLITALKGVYRDLGQVVSNLKTFEFLTMPKTGDGPKQEIAIVQRNAVGTITMMWFGTADFSTKSFRVYPIRNVQPASVAGELTGSFTTFANQSGTAVPSAGTDWWQSVREGSYKFNGTPAGIPAANRTGRYLVFRA
jgi:hypothetical protein